LGNRTLVHDRLVALRPWGTPSRRSSTSSTSTLQLKLTSGGLLHMWRRLQEVLFFLVRTASTGALHAPCCSRRNLVARGRQTHWLWAFATNDLTYYLIDRSRGEAACGSSFSSTSSGDAGDRLLGAYNAVGLGCPAGCLVHLLRDLHTVDITGAAALIGRVSPRKLRRLLGDAHPLVAGNGDFLRDSRLATATTARTLGRTDRHALEGWAGQTVAQTSAGVIVTTCLRSVDKTGVPFEQQLGRSALRRVIIRKNSYANRKPARGRHAGRAD